MRHRKLMAAVLSLAVILGVVSCKQQRDTEIGKDDTEITSAANAKQEETNPASEGESASDAPAPDLEGSYNSEFEIVEFTTSQSDTEVTTSNKGATTSETTGHSDEPIPTESLKETEAPKVTATPKPTSAPKATNTPVPIATPVPTEEAKATNTPTPSPIPTNTPTSEPTNTPTPVPTPFDIDQSARDNGYEIIDIDMGGGQTQRIYGYYVDMSELASRINNYRESIGLSRLPTDSNHVAESKLRAAEATVSFSHWRPNGRSGTEVNLSSGVNVDTCYNGLYASDGHRAWWEDTEVCSIYCVGFHRVMYDQEAGSWYEYMGATVVYMDF